MKTRTGVQQSRSSRSCLVSRTCSTIRIPTLHRLKLTTVFAKKEQSTKRKSWLASLVA